MPDLLVVRGGLFGNKRLRIRATDVEAVLPRERRVLVRWTAASKDPAWPPA
ncbi:MAG: hypothetical protein H0V20_02265 [Actinobacteria bacterium]|nr:hypothetical protein [Actinomycetota bacterium]